MPRVVLPPRADARPEVSARPPVVARAASTAAAVTRSQATGRLTGDVVAGGVEAGRDVHRAIADRVFAHVQAPPVRLLHDGIGAGVHAGVRGALRAGGSVSARLLAERSGQDWQSTPTGAKALAALNAAAGDRLDAEGSPLAVPMAFWRDGHPLTPTADGLASLPARSTLVVFLHGLGETEHYWRLVRDPDGQRLPGYAERLEADLDVACLALRYNTGRHISANGRSFADLLEAAVQAWPVPLERVCLVGHSMGGLVVRAACHVGQADGHAWAPLLSDVATLGSPHDGAPLERAANVADPLLHRLPTTRPLGRALRTRSVGVKDLRYGHLTDVCWDGVDPDAVLSNSGLDVPLLPGVRHHVAWAVLTRDPRHPVGALLGDLLVREGSATGTRRPTGRTPFTTVGQVGITGSHHFHLLHHPRVYAALLEWLTEPVEA